MKKGWLGIFLTLQAVLGFTQLGLLSPWMDEAITLMVVRRTPAAVVEYATHDIHPPLYYLLVWLWERLPLGLDWAVQARTFSVVAGLGATVAAWFLLVPRLPEAARRWFLPLWCLSPCLLLYSRMARSYTLQVLVATLAVAALLRYLERPGRRAAGLVGAAVTLTLYTHYAPGMAMLAVAGGAMLWRRQVRDAVGTGAVVAVGMTPWAWWLLKSLTAWGTRGNAYALLGGVAETGLKLGWWGMSFAYGETLPDGLLVLAGVVSPLLGWTLWKGWRGAPVGLRGVGLALAVVAFPAVSRWVAYPFLPARLLFLLPLVVCVVACGVASGRLGRAGAVAMLGIGLAGDWCYFRVEGFRNKQYPFPAREIAALPRPGDAFLVDGVNSDPAAMMYALPAGVKLFWSTDAWPDPGAYGGVWFLRNTHDITPGRENARIEEMLRRRLRLVGVRRYVKYTELERRVLPGLGEWASELMEFRGR